MAPRRCLVWLVHLTCLHFFFGAALLVAFTLGPTAVGSGAATSLLTRVYTIKVEVCSQLCTSSCRAHANLRMYMC